MTQHHTVILGGGYAGLMAAMRLNGRAKQHTKITLIDGRDHMVERIRLHQLAAGQKLNKHTYQNFLRKTAIRFVQGWVEQIDQDKQQIRLNDGRTIPFTHLIYALGSQIDTKRLPGIAEFTYLLQGIQAAEQLHQALKELPQNSRIAICGGGLTGIEIATEIAETIPHLNVSLITRGSFAESFSKAGIAYLQQICQGLKINLLDQHTITHFTENAIHCADKQPITADLIIWAGAFTVSPLAQQSGLPTQPNGQITVDSNLRAIDTPHIYAIGDAAHCATTPHAHPIRMACATAMPMGCYAADHLAQTLQNKRDDNPFRFNYFMWCVSLGRRAAIVQRVNPNDTPKERILTGRFAARIKEFICRFTIRSIYLERFWPGAYQWPQ